MSNTIKFNRKAKSCTECYQAEYCLARDMVRSELRLLENIIEHQPPLAKDQYLYHDGDPVQGVFIVRSGSLKLTTSEANGTEQVLGFYFPGDLVGLEGFGLGRHSCYAVALESTTVCQLPFSRLDCVGERIPGLLRRLISSMGREICGDHRKLLVQGKLNAEERMASFLLEMSNRFARRGYSSTEFNLSMTRHDIANYIGMAFETVSRLLGRMQDNGFIAVDRRNVRILNKNALLQLAHLPAMSVDPVPVQQFGDAAKYKSCQLETLRIGP